MTQIYIQSGVSLQKTVEIFYISVHEDLFVFKQMITTSIINDTQYGPHKFDKSKGVSIKSGFVNSHNLDLLLAGEKYTKEEFALASLDKIEEYRTKEYTTVTFWDITPNYYDEYVENNYTVDNVVKVDAQNFMIYDAYLKPLPITFQGNYLNGYHNENYDIPKILEILKNREDVTFFELDKNDPLFEWKAINLIPSYNATSTKHTFLEFSWHPSKEIWNKHFLNIEYFEHMSDIVIKNDLLGLEKCRKN